MHGTGQVDILFALFGSEEEGLEYQELLEAMQKREGYRMPQAKKSGKRKKGLPDLEYMFGCLKQCLSQ